MNPPSNLKYEFSCKTSNTSLHPHIKKYHLSLYMSLVNDYGWKITLPGLLTQAHFITSGAAALSRDEEKDHFSEHAFYKHLIRFIVVND